MLVMADWNFSGYPVAARVAATGADLLFRVKTNQWLPVLERLGDGPYRSVLATPASGRRHTTARHHGKALPGPPAGLAVPVIDADITITPAGGEPRTARFRRSTPLPDEHQAPPDQAAPGYAQRW